MKKVLSIALALVMIFALSAVAFADEATDATEYVSPTPKEYFDIVVSYEPGDGSLGDAVADTYQIIRNSDGTVTLIATPKGEGKFDKWIIEGEYDVVEGDLTDPTITIRPKSDIKADAVFVKATSDATEAVNPKPTTPAKPNNSSTSPKTGDPLFLIIALAALALGTGIFAVKKIKE